MPSKSTSSIDARIVKMAVYVFGFVALIAMWSYGQIAIARKAALAAECARPQSAFWRYHDLLLQRQDKLSPSALTDHAITLGLDPGRFHKCIDSEGSAESLRADIAADKRLGLHSTPVFFINGLYHKGPADYGDLARLISDAGRRMSRTDLHSWPHRKSLRAGNTSLGQWQQFFRD